MGVAAFLGVAQVSASIGDPPYPYSMGHKENRFIGNRKGVQRGVEKVQGQNINQWENRRMEISRGVGGKISSEETKPKRGCRRGGPKGFMEPSVQGGSRNATKPSGKPGVIRRHRKRIRKVCLQGPPKK